MKGRMTNEEMGTEHWWSHTDRVKLHHMVTCPSATVSTRKPMWTGLGLTFGLRSEMLANNHLNHKMRGSHGDGY